MKQDVDSHILIHPRKGKNEKGLPPQGLLLVNPSEASRRHAQLRQEGGESRFLFNSDLTVAARQSFFIAGPAIGAPMAAMSMEKLIALGAQRIILFGWCGAIASSLKAGDILVPHLAMVGEGTSQYYSLPTPATPSKILRVDIEQAFVNHGVRIHSGRVWSTDAVYREDRQLLQNLHKNDEVVAVDMEFSALCSVACFRDIEFAAVLVISDELWGQAWRPGFSSEIFLQAKAKAMDIALSVFGNYGE